MSMISLWTMSMKVSINSFLRLVSFMLAACICAVAANYDMNLGWFGRYARSALGATMLLMCIFFLVAQRLWKGGRG